MAEPPKLLLAESRRFGLEERVHVLNNGDSIQI